ncbi:beta-ketoacyl-ACP synthase II [bacterium]|nr:beta-ketoacyl-[acyl-carrier-protein] synthase II [Gemmatimonadota bacterium]MCH2664648.1 beta-ketoacyl-ACP synthase II [bacterium]HCK11889.1 beta-ketoacyl-[acyl-carrier-protein] synthase II [Candidatus Latescibacterota bacterium]
MGRDRRVVITGLGTLAPNGSTTEEYWDSLINGKTGIGRIEKFDTSDFRVQIGAEIKDFAPENYDMDRKFVRRADLFTQYSIAASFMAIADAGLDSKDAADPERIGVVYGSGIGGIQTFEVQHTALMNGGPRKISPFFIPMMIADMTSGQISIRFGAKGPNYTTVTACASASHGIGNAAREIRDDEADVMITGGAEAAVTPMSLGGFAALHALSTRNDEPERASRPFDAERDGFVIGEGAGSLILEELEHAKKRGARIYAEIVGAGYTGDAHHITDMSPGGEGGARALRRALRQADMKPSEIDYINAHGTSTPVGDKNESAAIRSVLGDQADKVAISSSKSMTGHLLGASGAIESIACVMAVHTNKIPPTINYENPDPECDLDYVPNRARKKTVNVAVNNSFGFGGHNATLILKKVTD